MEYVCGVIFDAQTRSKVLLIRKLRPEWQKGLLNFPGGKIEQGEVPAHAVSREIQEETGLYIAPKDWENFLINFGPNGQFPVYYFVAFVDNLGDARTQEQEEISIWDISKLNQIPSDLIANVRAFMYIALDQSGLNKPLILSDDGRQVSRKKGK